jgi:hypothetical protein
MVSLFRETMARSFRRFRSRIKALVEAGKKII